MTAEQFAYWLQGYAEMNEAPPSAEQWQSIREHLALVVQPAQYTPGQFAPESIVPIDGLRSRTIC